MCTAMSREIRRFHKKIAVIPIPAYSARGDTPGYDSNTMDFVRYVPQSGGPMEG